MRSITDQQIPVIDFDGLSVQPVDFFEQCVWINDHAVTDDADFARMSDSRGNQMQNEFLIDPVSPNNDGMACIMSALITGDDVEMRSDQVNDLAFAFIAPLCADDCEVHGFQ